MRTVRTKVYKFKELRTKEAKQKAIEQLRDINVDFDWWDFVYDDFKAICQLIGIDVDLKKTYFSGFAHQGQGASFTAEIDVVLLIEGIKGKKYLEHAPNLLTEVKSFTPEDCSIDRRVVDLIKRNWITISVSTVANDRPNYRSHVDFNRDYTYNECVNYNNIEKQLEELESWVEDIVGELENLLFRLLENDYEYQTSDEAVRESIIANEYEFTADGRLFTR